MKSNAAHERQFYLERLIGHDEWHEDLLSEELFGYVVEKVLEPNERFVLEEMVNYYAEGMPVLVAQTKLAQVMKITEKSVENYWISIKQKLRQGQNTNAARQLNKYLQKRGIPYNGRQG